MAEYNAPDLPPGNFYPSTAQAKYRAQRLLEQEDATKAELQEAADALGVRPAAKKGRTTKADLKEAIEDATTDNPDQES